MTTDTFKTKLSKLINKSRKAVRLYSTVARPGLGKSNERPYADIQLAEWRMTNEDLLGKLLTIIKNSNIRKAINDIAILKSQYTKTVNDLSLIINTKHRELIETTNIGDFVKIAKISYELIPLKAKLESKKAVLNELEDLVVGNITTNVFMQEKAEENNNLRVRSSKIIPFIKKNTA